MPRLLFEKTGDAVFISHLDLMRLFQRAFKRGGLKLKHTQGFTPRALVSIALPLSVGVESVCELLDYELEGQTVSHDEVVSRLNATMPQGVRVRESYDTGSKLKLLTHLRCRITLEYDQGIPEGAVEGITALFSRESLLVEKKGKNGPVMQDIIPMLSDLTINVETQGELTLLFTACAQNPTLNPQQLIHAIGENLPQCRPDFARIRRLEVLTAQGEVFR